jgi:hypothetical protein
VPPIQVITWYLAVAVVAGARPAQATGPGGPERPPARLEVDPRMDLPLIVASATTLLRISQDQHYFTDLLAGAIVGAGAGFIIPYLHRAGGPVVIAAMPVGDGYQVCVGARY